MSYLRRPDRTRDAIVRAWADREAGVAPLWPDGYAAWVVEGVRMLEAERGECQTRMAERRAREHRRRHGPER